MVEEGLDYGAAKRRAVKLLGLPPRTALPDNDTLEDAVRDHLAVFCAETQPAELLALRELALHWMQELAAFAPLVEGAVWNGTATRLSDIHLSLYTDDPKGLEIWLVDQRLRPQASRTTARNGQVIERLSLSVPCLALGENIGLHLSIHATDDVRGALVPDGRGRAPRGGHRALRERMASAANGSAPGMASPG